MKVTQEKRQRRKTTKVRTGCKTCKIRHVKCGEERPSCIQCSTTGRKCDGYELPTFIWTVAKKHAEPRSTTLICSTPAHNAFQGQELRSLTFFLNKTTAQIGSHFSQDLWSNIIPLLAQKEASIKHAVVALSDFHEQFSCENELQNIAVTSGLRHYNYAIQTLIAPEVQKSSPVIGLLSCIMFFAIELIQGRLTSALQLFRTGRRMVYEIRTKSFTASRLKPYGEIFETLKAAYMRFEYTVYMFCEELDKDLPFDICYGISNAADQDSPDVEIYSRTHTIAMFTSIAQAREELRRIAHTFVNNTLSQIEDDLSHMELLQNWCTAFEALKESVSGTVSIEDRRTLAGLEIWWRQVELTLLMTSDSKSCRDPLWFDQHEQRMSEIIDYVEIQCSLSADKSELDATLKQLSPSFCLETGFAGHLAIVVSRCRDPTIRRRALSVLKACNRQEGFLRRDIAIKSCERSIELEERGLNVSCSADVPAHARIVAVRMNIHPNEPRIDLKYLIGEEWIEDSLPLEYKTGLAGRPFGSHKELKII